MVLLFIKAGVADQLFSGSSDSGIVYSSCVLIFYQNECQFCEVLFPHLSKLCQKRFKISQLNVIHVLCLSTGVEWELFRSYCGR
jgi:hypothetical protein